MEIMQIDYQKENLDNFLKLSYEQRLEWLEEAQQFIQEVYNKNKDLMEAHNRFNECKKKDL